MYQYKHYTESMSGYYGTGGHGRVHSQAELVVGWNRGLRLCTQRAAAVFMAHFDFPLDASTTSPRVYVFRWPCTCAMKVRVQNHTMYIVVFSMAKVALKTPIASGRDAATPCQRRGMIPPRRSNTRSARSMSAPRFSPDFNCRELVLPLQKFR